MRFTRLTSYGPPPASTPAEVEQVLALAREGLSLRAIAGRVFGARRLKDRVARLLRQTYALDDVDAASTEPIDTLLVELLEDRATATTRSGRRPAPS